MRKNTLKNIIQFRITDEELALLTAEGNGRSPQQLARKIVLNYLRVKHPSLSVIKPEAPTPRTESPSMPPTYARYERVRKTMDRELYFTARYGGKTITIVKKTGEETAFPAEAVGVTNYIHANYDTDVIVMFKDTISDIAAKLIETGDWKKWLPPQPK